MKDKIKAHSTSGAERLSHGDHEFEMIDFSVSVSRLMLNALKVLYRHPNLKGTYDNYYWSLLTRCNTRYINSLAL